MRPMRVVVGVIAVVLLLAAQASASGDDPVVRITVAEPGEHVVVAVANPRTNGYDAPLSSVEPLIPDPLPASPGVSNCPAGQSSSELTLAFASGRSVRYTGCALPDRIRWLGRAVGAEAGQWSAPTVTRTVIRGATRTEARELRRLLRDLPLTAISRIAFGPQAARLGGIADAPVAMTVNNGPLRVRWEAGLLAGLYNQVATRLDLRPVATYDVKAGGSPLRPE